MKKLLICLFAMSAIISCGGGDSKKTNDTKVNSGDNSKNPDYQKGLELVAGSDCMTCHQIEQGIQGPSYRDVANRYASYSDTIVTHLANKIIKGGRGQWGDIWMTPHNGLSQEDAEAMVRYILLLKK